MFQKSFNQKRNELAKLDPYNSVSKISLNDIVEDKYYIGVKDVKEIPDSIIEKLEASDLYILHTLDKHSMGGRAVDINIKNPITGRCMTGSSSGTAVNVFTFINDLGIGTDGGGSVLAPALSLNLYSFISPLIEKEKMVKYKKYSTDAILFSPSIGFITRNYDLLIETIKLILPIQSKKTQLKIISNIDDKTEYDFETIKCEYPFLYGGRELLIKFLKNKLPKCDFLISKEGPIDVYGFGDSIFGSYGKDMKRIQMNSKKGLLRVVNMVNATAITIPSEDLATGYILICESNIEKISNMLEFAKKFKQIDFEVSDRYFKNLDMYDI